MGNRSAQFKAEFGSDTHRDRLLSDPATASDPGIVQTLARHGSDRHRAKIIASTNSWDTAYIAKKHYSEGDLTGKTNSELRSILAKHLG